MSEADDRELPEPMMKVLADYERHLVAERDLTAHTVRAYLGDIAGVLEHARRMGQDDPAQLDLRTLRSWLAQQQSLGRSRTTVARRATAARVFTAWLARTGRAATDVGASLGSPKAHRTLPSVLRADEASDLHVIELQGDSLTVSAKQVLAFDADLTFDEQRLDGVGIQGGAMYVLAFSGQGSVVVMTKGTPVVLNCDAPTFADTNAVVAWSSSMRVTVASAVRLQQMHWATGPTGETYTLQMLGMPGQFVIVQPYEV